MRCIICEKEGKRHKVILGPYSKYRSDSTTTYFDEDDVRHIHDTCIMKQNYSCSSGHNWAAVMYVKCPADGCDFGKDFGKESNDVL